jgi:acyl-CoA thioesterase
VYPADLARDTAVEPIPKVPGGYVAELPDHWNYVNPCGGALVTVALRAMAREVADDGMFLLSATTIFCQPIQAGSLDVKVRVLRRGDRAVQVHAALGAKDLPGPGLEVLGTFARDRTGPDVHGIAMPDVPRPDEARATASRTGNERFNIYKNLDVSLALGDAMWEPGWQEGPAHVAFWYRYRVPQRDAAGRFDPLAIPPLADTMPSALVRRLGPEHDRFVMPSLDLSMFFIAPTRSDWVLVETFVERARAGFALGSANVWDESGQLVARAAQSMTMRLLGPRKQPPVARREP